MPAPPSVASSRFAVAVFAAALLIGSAAPVTAAEPVYSPATVAIDAACNADRAKAPAADVVRMVRFAAAGESLGAWRSATGADVSRMAMQSDFAVGELATIVFGHDAIVGADSTHSDAATSSVLARAWCFIGGKLARETADVTFLAHGSGYRRTRYYGDDLQQPLAEEMIEKSPRGKTYTGPSKDVDATIAIDPIARPSDLPFYAAAEAARAYRAKP